MSLYPSIRIEGGLLGPDVLDQLFSRELPGQRPADFGLDGKRNLTDEIAATFADARALWGVFQHRLDRLKEDDVATSVTRDAWVIPFLGLLGYEPRRAGVILPKGIATDDTTKYFFGSIVSSGRLVDLIGFENEEFIFPAIDHRVTFCKMTMAGVDSGEHRSRIGFFIRRFSQLAEEQRFFSLEKSDFWLLNPNTGNCPIFRTQADAELTKAIYRRVPILWHQATDNQPESNPWRLTFNRMFDMANDSHHFRTAEELEADAYRLEGNIFVSPYDRYLPLYEAKMLHQFDHRFSTYEGATQKQLNVGILPRATPSEKAEATFAIRPRYWLREEVVESAIPKYPAPLAAAVQIEHRQSIQRVLLWWGAGFHLAHGDEDAATRLLMTANQYDIEKSVAKTLTLDAPLDACRDLQDTFPLTAQDATVIEAQIAKPEAFARDLLDRFSPKWLMGWRDITNVGNERTLLASAVPRVAVGDKFLLAFSTLPNEMRRVLLAVWNSFVCDYGSRQKVGSTSLKYFTMRQLPVLSPSQIETNCVPIVTSVEFFGSRVLELCYTANDLVPLGPEESSCRPFRWDEERRFLIRCELDAAMFHLYLPAEPGGHWRRGEGETDEQLAALTRHFPTPRDAVGFILDQFPITRDNEKKAHGRYRTKDRIMEIYDEMLEAQRIGQPYQTRLDPPPADPRVAHLPILKETEEGSGKRAASQ